MNVKTRLLSTTAVCVALTFSQPAQGQSGQQSASNAMMKSMQSGMSQMMKMKMTGDPDHDFASMMRMHHQGAVDMADLELKQGKDVSTKALASRIKAANQKEIKEMTQFLSTHKPMKSSSSKMGQGGMMQSMHSGKHAMNGKADHDFASMMVEHHQGAVDMSRAFLKEGKTAQMKTLANRIIREQTKEIAELKKLEASLKE